ncbi:MAG: DUF1553 domain-containing protein [Planctomycetes bacterium]|nr:DUF1553 domain-containing protein [Planctomycetota bacterium]
MNALLIGSIGFLVMMFGEPDDPSNPVDRAVSAALRTHRIEAAPLCSDATFLRRVFLDMLGTLPTAEEVVAFRRDPSPDKRARLIDSVFERPEYVVFQTLRWCDWLRVKSEFPINLWPNAVQAYHRWIFEAIRANRPLDAVARELLIASGSNFREPAVNFWRAVPSRDARALAQTVALTFLGQRVERWPAERLAGFALCFSRVHYKRTNEWKEEIVLDDPAPRATLHVVFPDGTSQDVPPDVDPRRACADWLLGPGRTAFARAVVHRAFYWIMGRSLVSEPDDLHPGDPPTIPALEEALVREFVGSGFDLRHLQRVILNSATYQRSCVPASRDPRAEALFAHAAVPRLPAEVLIDAICRITGSQEEYVSPTPEPYTFVPRDQRTIALEDGSITSAFLETFGRPSRDTGLLRERDDEPTEMQLRHLLNSSDLQRRIERSAELSRIVRQARSNPRRVVRSLYVTILSREPTKRELDRIVQHAEEHHLTSAQTLHDTTWALLNSREFLHRH